jgi:transposase-like protein
LKNRPAAIHLIFAEFLSRQWGVPHLPKDEAVFKLLYLALKNIEKKWTMPIREWKRALQQFAIVFEGRMPLP